MLLPLSNCGQLVCRRGLHSAAQLFSNLKVVHHGPVDDWRAKNYTYTYKWARGRKVAKVNLPNFDEERNNSRLPPDEIRAKLKEMGVVPRRQWTGQKPLIITTAGEFLDPYVPPEGDGKSSIITKKV